MPSLQEDVYGREWTERRREASAIAQVTWPRRRSPLVIVALRACPVRDPADLVAFLDMQDHAVYSPEEITRALDALVAEGKALREKGAWRYDEARLARERFVF